MTGTATALGLDFALPAELTASAPAETRGLTRDGVRLLTARRVAQELTHTTFRALPELLRPGDLLVVNTSATLPAAVRMDRITVHFSTPLPDGDWLVELRERRDKAARGTARAPSGGATGTAANRGPAGTPAGWTAGTAAGRAVIRAAGNIASSVPGNPAPGGAGAAGTPDDPTGTPDDPAGTPEDLAGTSSGPAGTSSGPAGTSSGPAGTSSGPAGTSSGPAGTSSGPAGGAGGPALGGVGEAPTVTAPYRGGAPGEWLPLPGGATLRLLARHTPRLWRARLDTDVVPYLHRYGVPIRYDYVPRDWPLHVYQTVFARPGPEGSAEMPSAGRAFTSELVTRLVAAGVLLAPITLHTGVASPEAHEPPYSERFEVPETTARLVNDVRGHGGRVIAVGTTAVRALETAANTNAANTNADAEADASTNAGAGRGGRIVRAARGWTDLVVTPERGVRAVDGILTGLHEPRSSHLWMLTAIAGMPLVERCYGEALDRGYLWHEFGDLNLLLP
jgi:S-adenosylmethionine:tRNA-ribosyltransferase-isomerase (queuine synthetase)